MEGDIKKIIGVGVILFIRGIDWSPPPHHLIILLGERKQREVLCDLMKEIGSLWAPPIFTAPPEPIKNTHHHQ